MGSIDIAQCHLIIVLAQLFLFLKVAETRVLLVRRCCNSSTVLLGCQNINPFHDIFPQYAHYNMYKCSDIIDKNTAFVGKYCCFLKLNLERKITENILIQDTQNFFENWYMEQTKSFSSWFLNFS